MWICDNFFFDPVATLLAGIYQSIGRNPLGEIIYFRICVAFFFRKEISSVGNDQAEVTCTGSIYSRIVDLIKDAMADRKPDVTGRIQGCP